MRRLLSLSPSMVAAALFLFGGSFACAPAAPRGSLAKRDPLAVDAIALKARNPACALTIVKGPFQYFRYANRPFVDLVCSRYASSLEGMPLVHAHGDAHLEQYAVAKEGHGLADFDASAVGPFVVDLARFATSLVLAWPHDAQAARKAIDALLAGYVRALDDPAATAPEPAAAARLHARFESTTLAWLDKTQKLILPASPEEQPAYDAAWHDFVAQMRARDPNVDPAFFKIKVGGRLEMGLGSANAEKFLARIEGPSVAPEDDLIVEAKELEPGALGSCMRGVDLDAMRVIKGQSQISNSPQRFLAAVKIGRRSFYSHTWLVHYQELSTTDIGSGAELAELAYDVGLQLGRGHAKQEDASRVPEQRRALKRAALALVPNLGNVAVELAAHVTEAWANYREQIER